MQNSNRFVFKRNAAFIRTAALIIPVVCVLLLLSQTAFAQNTYVITDGNRVVIHTTSSTNPADVLGEAGLELGEDDTYTTQAGIGVSEITVQRSQTVTIDHCGKLLEVDTYGETVEELLARLNISTSGDTTVSVPLDTQTENGMTLSISRTVRAMETYTVEIPHETVRCYDASIPAGKEVVLNAGSAGQAECTASVVYVDGQEVSRTVLSETVITRPVDEIIAVGTGDEASATASESDAPIIGDGIIITATGEVLTYTHSMQVLATAYTNTDAGCDEWTATGTLARVGAIAVDPRMIPYGTRMFIVTNDGQYIYGVATAEDCGGAIKSKRVDLYFDTTAECFQFGVRDCTIYFLG